MGRLEDVSMRLSFTQLQTATAGVLTCVGLWVARKAYLAIKGKDNPLPPGPLRLPVVGNLFDMPTSYEWEAVTDWGKKYGELYSLNWFKYFQAISGDLVFTETLGFKVLFINSYEAATELLEKRSATYSTRPPFVLGRQLYVTSVFYWRHIGTSNSFQRWVGLECGFHAIWRAPSQATIVYVPILPTFGSASLLPYASQLDAQVAQFNPR